LLAASLSALLRLSLGCCVCFLSSPSPSGGRSSRRSCNHRAPTCRMPHATCRTPHAARHITYCTASERARLRGQPGLDALACEGDLTCLHVC
jgi:hypothetical protein